MGWLATLREKCLPPRSELDAVVSPPDNPGKGVQLHDLPDYLEQHLDPLIESYQCGLAGPKLKATQLLFRVLPRAEIGRFVLYQVVRAPRGDNGFFEIALGRRSNIVYYDREGRARIIYCAMPVGAEAMQEEDVVAAQYLALCHDREAFLKIANRQFIY